MLNDAKVASLGFFKGKVCLTRFSKKNFRTQFQVLSEFSSFLPEYVFDTVTRSGLEFIKRVLAQCS